MVEPIVVVTKKSIQNQPIPRTPRIQHQLIQNTTKLLRQLIQNTIKFLLTQFKTKVYKIDDDNEDIIGRTNSKHKIVIVEDANEKEENAEVKKFDDCKNCIFGMYTYYGYTVNSHDKKTTLIVTQIMQVKKR